MAFFRTILIHLRRQWFSLAMLALLGAAWAWPEGGDRLNPDRVASNTAVVLIFFLTGLTLRSDQLVRGLRRWRAHLLVQFIGFLVLPAACWFLLVPLRERLPEGLVYGFYLLAVLPTTISSSVVLTQMAGGRTAVAVFNAVGGNLAGVIVSPALFMVMSGADGGSGGLDLDALAVFARLARLIIAPMAFGQVVHWVAAGWPARFSRAATRMNAVCVLVIVYMAFCAVMAGHATDSYRLGDMLWLAALVPAHLAVLGLVAVTGRLAVHDRKDRIAILFCASQKTLGLGLPLIAACLSDHPELIGPASLPLIVYHPLQLVVAGVLVDRFRSVKARPAPGL